jgi:hypothetical protein
MLCPALLLQGVEGELRNAFNELSLLLFTVPGAHIVVFDRMPAT